MKNKEHWEQKKKRLKASATIEMAYIVPLIFLVFLVVTHLGFFFHDKNTLQSIVYEAVMIGQSQYRNEGAIDSEVLQEFLENQSEQKLLYFQQLNIEIKSENEEVAVEVETERNGMNIQITKAFALTEPENVIRKAALVESVVEGVISGGE
ncbi:MAG: TadE/TadG family type IV pilus assembly protein [Eubacteriales bacterium]